MTFASAGLRTALAAGLTFGLSCSLAASAYAADDGQASLITGIATSFGLTKDKQPHINYHERSKLVVPPKKELPPPGSAAADAAWPVDGEVLRDREERKIEDGGPSAKDYANKSFRLFNPGDDVKVTTSGFEGGGRHCRVPDPKTGECPDKPHAEMNWNPMTWVGLQKKPEVVLGAEPERENLVDPPKGYRSPAEGVGAKIQQ